MIMNKEEEEDVMYRIYFSECNHTMDANLQFLIKEAKRTPDGESYYICKDCNEHKRGYCEKTPLKRAAMIIRLSPSLPLHPLLALKQQRQNNNNRNSRAMMCEILYIHTIMIPKGKENKEEKKEMVKN